MNWNQIYALEIIFGVGFLMLVDRYARRRREKRDDDGHA